MYFCLCEDILILTTLKACYPKPRIRFRYFVLMIKVRVGGQGTRYGNQGPHKHCKTSMCVFISM